MYISRKIKNHKLLTMDTTFQRFGLNTDMDNVCVNKPKQNRLTGKQRSRREPEMKPDGNLRKEPNRPASDTHREKRMDKINPSSAVKPHS